MTTEKRWLDLSPEEKRDERFHWWLSPPNVKFASLEAEKAYKVRVQRLIDVYKVQEPDRVPVSLPVGALPAYLNGTDYRTVMYDYDKALQAWIKFNKEFETDYLVSPAMVLPGKVYELLDYKLYTWPGHGMPESANGYQYVEGEYMKEDEYDALITDPSDFLMRVFMPRAFGALQPYSMLQSTVRVIELPIFYLMSYAMPPIQTAQLALIDAGKELAKWMASISQFTKQGMELGFPPMASGAFCKAPFDNLGDTLRGTKGIMMDMYRQRDKLIEAMDVLADMTIRSVLSTINITRGLAAIFPLHKGADGWMSDKQFETLYWPSLKKIIDALIREGILIILFAEGSFNTRLESINEFPKGAIHWMCDRCSISGNVPASLLVSSTPQEVKEYCRKLIETCGKGGGYMLSSGTADITEAKPDNLRAMMEAAKEYGVYK
jgi:hypothetical protein